ncbi:amino acid permease [Sorangium cellulosum]|uniref:Amino acid permease n=1 Tax=Sorangium cellulosum TaxID=56 RepID=A0A150PXQ8_SORCE|nr:amino acid permease [Sorangium cellulosum]KYF60565.1 amino acid permease [Sorangium cellulosum]
MGSRLLVRKPLSLLKKELEGEHRLRRALGPLQLTSLGIGAIVGTGIFVLTGQAAHDKAGPSLMLSFVVAGLACVFAALCYAEFAAMVPVAGSAYTYAYATLGELPAWIIGWDLVLEYAVGAAAVAHGWSHYFQDFIGIFGVQLPRELRSAPFDYDPALGELVSTGAILDLPAILVTTAVTMLLLKGIRESAAFNAAMVVLKLAVVLFVLVVGAFYVNPDNWRPFAPFGYGGLSFFGHTIFGEVGKGGEPLGMLAGAATIFFAYIGFDAVSTHAEESKCPQRDLPIGIVASLVICTVLYVAVAAILTGMVPYTELSIDAPVSDAFARVGLPWAQFIISLGAIAGITSVLLVLMLSQPRVLLAIARDGLLPRSFFGSVHPVFRTPWKSTFLTGFVVAALSAFLPLRILAELVNIGTLLAFLFVCAAVLIMRRTAPDAPRPFRVPLYPLTPILGIAICLLLMFSLPTENWLRLAAWLLLGLAIYFGYGRKHSTLTAGP